jgi:PAS domain S-box-containing protein
MAVESPAPQATILPDETKRDVPDSMIVKMLDYLPVPCFVLDDAGNVACWNQAIVRATGWNRHDILGQCLASRVVDSNRLKKLLAARTVDTTDHNEIFAEVAFLWADNQPHDSLISLMALPEQVMGHGMLGILTDISSYKAQERELQLDMNRLQTILDSEPECVKLVSRDCRLLKMNPAGLAMVEAEHIVEVLDEDVSLLIDEEDRAEFRRVYAAAFNGESGTLQFGLNGLKGTRRRMETKVAPLRDTTGEVVAALSITRDITQRQHAELELERVANDLTQLIDTANAPIFGIDASGLVNEWNQTAERITGYSKADVMGQPLVKKFITEDYQNAVSEVFDNALGGKETDNFEFPLYTKGGERVEVLLNATTRRDAAGKVVGVVGVGQNITERKRLEAPLRQLAFDLAKLSGKPFFDEVCRQLAAAAEVDYVFVGELSADGLNVSLLGGVALGQTMGSMQYALVGTPCERVIGNSICVYRENVCKQFPEDRILADWDIEGYLGTPIFDKEHKPLGILVAMHRKPLTQDDVINQILAVYSDRVAAEMQRGAAEDNLRQSEARLRTIANDLTQLIDTANAPIFGIDASGLVNEWNQTAERITGYSKADVMGQPLVDKFITEDYRDAVSEVFNNALGGKETDNFEFPLYTKGGERVEVLLNATTRRDAAGKVVGVVGVGQDITERKQAELELSQERENLEFKVQERTRELLESLEQLERTNKMLEEADRHKSRFLSTMSHELRTPLNAILGFTDLLGGQFFGHLNERQGKYVQQIDDSGQHLLALINDLLDVAKIDAGAIDLELEPLDIRSFAESVVNMMSAQFTRKNQIVHRQFAPGLPKARVDVRRCRQIFLNILSNAHKYAPENGEIEVAVIRDTDDALRVDISDNGLGIDATDQSRVFTEFFQADRSRDEKLGGTGIGLALTRRLVELHGGSIEVHSPARFQKIDPVSKGVGTTFTFTFPLSGGFLSSGPGHTSESTHKGARILVVEDNETNLTLVTEILALGEHVVSVARNGQEAIDACMSADDPFELILMDINMPIVDGLTATKVLRQMEGYDKTPIIALTAMVDRKSIKEQVAAGCTNHLAKPLQVQDLMGLLKKHLPEESHE